MQTFKLIQIFFILFIFNLLWQVSSNSNDPFKIELPVLHSQDYKTRQTCENIIEKLIENFRNIMSTGSKLWGIPPLEPFERSKVFVNGSQKDLGNITGYMTDLKVDELSTFIVTNIKCSKLVSLHPKFQVNLTIPFLNITGNYDLSGYAIDMVPMYGNGPFSINITNLYIGIIARSNIYWKFSNLNIWLAIDEAQVYFYNLLDGDPNGYEDLFNRMFSAISPIAVEDLWPPVEPYISNMIIEMVNTKISNWNN